MLRQCRQVSQSSARRFGAFLCVVQHFQVPFYQAHQAWRSLGGRSWLRGRSALAVWPGHSIVGLALNVSRYVYRALTSNEAALTAFEHVFGFWHVVFPEVADAESLASVRRALDEVGYLLPCLSWRPFWLFAKGAAHRLARSSGTKFAISKGMMLGEIQNVQDGHGITDARTFSAEAKYSQGPACFSRRHLTGMQHGAAW